jgi:hypothetical protein
VFQNRQKSVSSNIDNISLSAIIITRDMIIVDDKYEPQIECAALVSRVVLSIINSFRSLSLMR